MDYDDFELQLGPPVGDGYLVRVLRSPAGQGETVVRLPEAAEPEVGRDFRNRVSTEVPSTQTGGHLFRCLFTGPVGDLFLQSLSPAGAQRGLRIRLRINPREEGLERLHRLPWELLYREDTDDFLALSRRTPVVRALDVARPAAEWPFDPPLRILVVISQDPYSGVLGLEEELKQLRVALRKGAGAVLEVLENPSVRALRETLDCMPFHVLHYMGHGTFDPVSGEGALLLRGPDGKREILSGRHLSTKIKDVSSLRLVVLNACETALTSGSPNHNPFAGVAAALLLGGVPAVVAMQSTIDDHHAIAFSAAFYQQLARGMPVDEAITEGRQAIHSLHPERDSWATPVLFLRTQSGDLFARRSRRGRPRRSTFVIATGAVLVLTLVGSVPVLLDRLKSLAPESAPAGEQRSAGSIPAAGTPIPQTVQTPPRKEASIPSRTGDAARTLRVGEGSDALRVEIAGARSFPGAFDTALRRFLQSPSESLAGWTIRLDANAPQVTSTAVEQGEPMQSCRLSITGQLRGYGRSYPLGPVLGTGAAFNASSACDLAAAKLAQSVVHEITSRLGKEGSR